jgi:hypothetical protein
MSTERNINPFSGMRKMLHFLAWFALLTCAKYEPAAGSQNNKSHDRSLELIAELKTGAFGPVTEQQISEARAGRLVPVLEARFAISKDPEMKARIASALVKLGDTDNTYWNLLVEQATPAAESDAPNPKCLGLAAKCGSGPSPEYTVWANAQFVSARDHHSLDDDVKKFFTLSNAMLDASIAAWDAKRTYDSVRPVTAISLLYKGKKIRAWGGPGKGTVEVDGSQWLPYQPATFPTPPFPDYVSGHSAYSAAAARILVLWDR